MGFGWLVYAGSDLHNQSPAHSLESQLLNLLRLFLIGRAALVAENLFLRKQLALFQKHKVRPRNGLSGDATVDARRRAVPRLARSPGDR